jgi:DNA-binding CsgD family transcriptional regulator
MRMDVSPLLEACYAPARHHQRWASEVVDGFSAAFPCFREVGINVAACDVANDTTTLVAAAAPPSWMPLVDLFHTRPLRENHAFLYPPTMLSSTPEVMRELEPSAMGRSRSEWDSVGVLDGVAIVVHPTPTIAVIVFANGAPALVRERRTRTALARAALHIESGFRLRVQQGAVRAVMTADGQLLDGEVADTDRARLADAARGAEAARSTRDLGLWTALVAGHLSVVPRMRGSRRVYELVENERFARGARALSRREVDVLELASTGLSTKLCGYALGLSPTTISTTLANAARKLGGLNHLELLRVAALLAHDPRADADEPTLTAAERDVLALIRQGLSNAEIAAQRGRSVRTIANQVARLLEKTGRPSRRALLAG